MASRVSLRVYVAAMDGARAGVGNDDGGDDEDAEGSDGNEETELDLVSSTTSW